MLMAERPRRTTQLGGLSRTLARGANAKRVRSILGFDTAEIRVRTDEMRPKTRGECIDGIRPCPFVGCRHHNYLDVNEETGSIKINFPNIEIEDMTDSCSLDAADEGGMSLDEVGAKLNITRERTRQIEHLALQQLKSKVEKP